MNTSQLSNLISLNKPLVSREINEIHQINQENSPDVGDIPSIKEFKELTELSDVIYAFKDKDKIIGFILLMREGSSYKSENYKFISCISLTSLETKGFVSEISFESCELFNLLIQF